MSGLLITSGLLFGLSAVIGTWAAYDRSVASGRLALILIGVVALVGVPQSVRWKPNLLIGLLGTLSVVATVGISIYFFLTTVWPTELTQDFLPFFSLTVWIQEHRPQFPFLSPLHSNGAAQVVSVLLPLAAGTVCWWWLRGWRLWALAGSISVMLGAGGLLMTFSRGGWLGLLVGICCAALVHGWTGRNSSPGGYYSGMALVIAAIVMFAAIFLVSVGFSVGPELLGVLPSPLVSLSRPPLWQEVLDLNADYRFTGSGLGNSTMVLSSYAFLLHVPFFQHAHNLYLQVSLEQGYPGVIALGGLSGAALGIVFLLYRPWYRSSVHRHDKANVVFLPAAMVSLLALVIHGIFDAEGYVSGLMPLLFLPFALVFALWVDAREALLSCGQRAEAIGFSMLGAIVLVFFVMTLFIGHDARAAFQANMGAVLQTQAELSVYSWPEWPIQDALRRDGGVDLEPAINRYTTALQFDAQNVVANRRLGQIALSQGDFMTAQQYLETAAEVAPGNRATRQMLGEIYAIAGDIEKAADFWGSPDTGYEQLSAREWWYQSQDAQTESIKIAQAIRLLTFEPQRR